MSEYQRLMLTGDRMGMLKLKNKEAFFIGKTNCMCYLVTKVVVVEEKGLVQGRYV